MTSFLKVNFQSMEYFVTDKLWKIHTSIFFLSIRKP